MALVLLSSASPLPSAPLFAAVAVPVGGAAVPSPLQRLCLQLPVSLLSTYVAAWERLQLLRLPSCWRSELQRPEESHAVLCAQYSWQLVAGCSARAAAASNGWDHVELLRLLTRFMARAERSLWLDLPAPSILRWLLCEALYEDQLQPASIVSSQSGSIRTASVWWT